MLTHQALQRLAARLPIGLVGSCARETARARRPLPFSSAARSAGSSALDRGRRELLFDRRRRGAAARRAPRRARARPRDAAHRGRAPRHRARDRESGRPGRCRAAPSAAPARLRSATPAIDAAATPAAALRHRARRPNQATTCVDADGATPVVERVEHVGFAELNAHRTAARALAVVALEVAIDAGFGHFERHALRAPSPAPARTPGR